MCEVYPQRSEGGEEMSTLQLEEHKYGLSVIKDNKPIIHFENEEVLCAFILQSRRLEKLLSLAYAVVERARQFAPDDYSFTLKDAKNLRDAINAFDKERDIKVKEILRYEQISRLV
jgi:hypothetical protein